ncbi:MAG: methanogenesis marker 14 protein [Halobacteriota archaeon]
MALGLLGAKPKVAKNQEVSLLEIKKGPFYVVASVEVGNTTTKCILTATNMLEGKAYVVNKVVNMTRDVRDPKPGEEIFGRTLTYKPLTRNSIAEMVKGTLIKSVRNANLELADDLHFVVRSTGVVAGFDQPEDIGEFIKALADGCLMAGVTARKMTPAMSLHHLPKKFREYSLLDKVAFDGSVSGVLPPIGSTGVEVVANEMEGELATAGIKEGAKWADVDFRNPCLSMDFGTTFKGRITNDVLPYANTIANFCGISGEIVDSVGRGTGLVDETSGTTFDLPKLSRLKVNVARERDVRALANEIHEHIRIEEVPKTSKRFGSVPVNPHAAAQIGLILIGVDSGENGSDLHRISKVGGEIYEDYGLGMLYGVIDWVSTGIAERIINTAFTKGLINDKVSIGITGRAGITGNKPSHILKAIKEMGIYSKPEDYVVFVDDGLARGAAIMARCMNSLGTPKNPFGGLRGGKCILGQRIRLQTY